MQFQVRWYQGSLPRYENVGADAIEAQAALDRKQFELKTGTALSVPTPTPAAPKEELSRVCLAEEFMELKQKAERDVETLIAYENLLSEFCKASGKPYADEPQEIDLLNLLR